MTATPPRSRRSAGASTGCRSRSSSRPPAAGCCRRPRSPSAWTPRSARRAPARATPPRASRRCGRRSTGATSCSATPSSGASRASRCSPAVRPSRRPRRSPAPDWTRSTAWSPRACSDGAGTRSRPPAWGCSRRSAPTPASASPRAADADAVREDHYRYYLALAQRHGTERALRGAGGTEHLATLDAEIDNLHAALGWAIAQPSADAALALTAALGCYWVMRDRHAEALDWIDQALNLPGPDAHPALRVRALSHEGQLPVADGPRRRATRGPGRAGGHRPTAWRSRDPLPSAPAAAPHHEMDAERLDTADALADEALRWARAAGDEWEIAEASRAKAIAAASIPDLRERVDRAASLLTDAGNIQHLATLLTDAAYAALCLGGERDATALAARATPIARALDDRLRAMINSGNLGLAALLTGETDTASHAFREELTLCRDMVVRPVAFEGLRGLAAVAVVKGDDSAPRCSSAPLTHTATTSPGSGRGQARRDVLRARAHALRPRRMECRREPRQRAELRGRHRLRSRGRADVSGAVRRSRASRVDPINGGPSPRARRPWQWNSSVSHSAQRCPRSIRRRAAPAETPARRLDCAAAEPEDRRPPACASFSATHESVDIPTPSEKDRLLDTREL